MALLTTLKLKDVSDDYKVADFHLHMSRSYNQFNPESAPSCESIEMTVVAPSTDDYTIYEWYNNDSLLSGPIRRFAPSNSWMPGVSNSVRAMILTTQAVDC